ncbi:MAG: T9SS type A sorting domain-containing protein, partial [Bacteroidia bacterium]|nr:T9SS type A sorting domain-containing protein [Bacteroidia bacterium]
YYLTVGGKGETDKGNYNLEISRLQGLEVSLIAEQLLSIYPNPAQNQITVSSSIKIDSYQIFNTVGEEVLRGNLTNPTIQIESLLTGSYFILLRDGNSNQTYHKKFIK